MTAVEWLVKKLEESGIPLMKDELEMIQQAKQMEKEQIEKAYQQGALDGYEPNYGSGEQYYNETYGKSNGNRLA